MFWMTSELAADLSRCGDLCCRRCLPFRWHHVAYRDWDRNAFRLAAFGLHWPLKLYGWWLRHRWAPARWAIRHGWAELQEGDYYRNAVWWPAQRWRA